MGPIDTPHAQYGDWPKLGSRNIKSTNHRWQRSIYCHFLPYLTDIADDDFADEDLVTFTSSEDGEFVLAFDPALQTAKLSLLRIIIEGSYEDDDYDGDENGQTLDPFVRFVFLMINSIICRKETSKKIQ